MEFIKQQIKERENQLKINNQKIDDLEKNNNFENMTYLDSPLLWKRSRRHTKLIVWNQSIKNSIEILKKELHEKQIEKQWN